MNNFTVSEIIDGDTFNVRGGWSWKMTNGQTVEGVTVRPTGYNTPEVGSWGYQNAKNKLTNLIHGKIVELRNPVTVSYNRIVCDVYYNGRNLADYFPEHQ